MRDIEKPYAEKLYEKLFDLESSIDSFRNHLSDFVDCEMRITAYGSKTNCPEISFLDPSTFEDIVVFDLVEAIKEGAEFEIKGDGLDFCTSGDSDGETERDLRAWKARRLLWRLVSTIADWEREEATFDVAQALAIEGPTAGAA